MYCIKQIANTQDKLGECPIWDVESQSVWWTDINSNKLYRLNIPSDKLDSWNTPERLCSFGLHKQGGLIAAFESGFCHYNPDTNSHKWFVEIESDLRSTRLNDGRCDRFGRFIAGSMVEGKQLDNPAQKKGSLYSIDSKRNVRRLFEGLSISNSICWSPDNQYLYLSDSAAKTIWRFDYDSQFGTISHQQEFARTEGNCFPDGSAIDSNGCLWNAQWGASQIVQYKPDGTIAEVFKLPVTQPSCVTFGGSDLKTLYITSARDGLSQHTLEENPLNGSLLSLSTEVAGLPEGRFGS